MWREQLVVVEQRIGTDQVAVRDFGPDERATTPIGKLGSRPLLSADELALEYLALRLLLSVQPRMLLIDEVHHLLAGTAREQRRALTLLKTLANVLQIAIVDVGARDALQAISTDPQVVSRFEPTELPPWGENDTFHALLLTLVRGLPLCKASPLANRACAQLLLRRSEGITGRVCWIVAQAAKHAIRSGTETIDAELPDRVSPRPHWQPV